MLMYKLGVKSSLAKKWEFVALALVIGLPLTLYIISGTTSSSLKDLFKSYLVNCYGDVIAIGYIPSTMDQVCANSSILKDYTGYLVVPSYAVSNGKGYPLLLGYTEAAYRNDTLLGGFKAPPLKPGEAVLLRGYTSFIKPGMRVTVYPAITINEEVAFNLTIVGYAEGALPLPAGPVLFLSKADGKKLLEAFGGYTVYSLVFKKNMNEKEALEEAMKLFKEANAYIAFLFYSKKDLIFYPGQDVILGSENALKFMSVSSWTIATILILIISLVMIEKNLREVATIRSLGATGKELFQYLFSYWLARGLAGFVIALVLGTSISWSMISLMLSHPRLQPLKAFVKLNLDLPSALTALSMSIVTALLASIASLFMLKKIDLIEAMRFYGVKFVLKFESKLPPSALIAVSELRGLPWKAVGALLVLAIGSASVTVPIQLSRSIDLLKLPHYYDVELTVLKIPRISLPLSMVLEQLKDVKGVKDMSLWLTNLYGSVNFKMYVKKGEKGIYVKGYACMKPIKGSCFATAPPLIQGRYPKSWDEVAVSNLLAKELNLKIGDIISVKIHTLNLVIRGKVKVVGIYDWPMSPPSLIFNMNLLKGIDISHYKTFVILAKTEGSPEKVAKALQSIFVNNAYAAASKTWSGFYSDEKNNLRYLKASLVMSMAVGFSVVVISTLMYAFADMVTRTKIFALLKSIGFDSTAFTKVVVVKWLVLAALSTLLLPLVSYPLYESAIEALSSIYLLPKTFNISIYAIPFAIVPFVVPFIRIIYKGLNLSEELKG